MTERCCVAAQPFAGFAGATLVGHPSRLALPLQLRYRLRRIDAFLSKGWGLHELLSLNRRNHLLLSPTWALAVAAMRLPCVIARSMSSTCGALARHS
jgi:hypothetical protein